MSCTINKSLYIFLPELKLDVLSLIVNQCTCMLGAKCDIMALIVVFLLEIEYNSCSFVLYVRTLWLDVRIYVLRVMHIEYFWAFVILIYSRWLQSLDLLQIHCTAGFPVMEIINIPKLNFFRIN